MGNLKYGWESLVPQDPGIPEKEFGKVTETLGTFGVGSRMPRIRSLYFIFIFCFNFFFCDKLRDSMLIGAGY